MSISITDNDECFLGTDNCHQFSQCHNTMGSFSCSCQAGYEGDGVSECNGKYLILNTILSPDSICIIIHIEFIILLYFIIIISLYQYYFNYYYYYIINI